MLVIYHHRYICFLSTMFFLHRGHLGGILSRNAVPLLKMIVFLSPAIPTHNRCDALAAGPGVAAGEDGMVVF